MNVRLPNKSLAIAAFLAASTGLFAADPAASAPAKPVADVAAPAKVEKLLPTDVKKITEKFSAQRDAVLADRQALLDQLKTATAEQRKAIIEKMQAQQKDLLDAQRALGKQIRDDLRQLRQSQPTGVH